jgi:hypothetical protein
MSPDDLIDQLLTLQPSPAGARCDSIEPGHAPGQPRDARLGTSRDDFAGDVDSADARVTGVTGEYVILALPGGPLVARTHAAPLLAEIVAQVAADGGRVRGRFSARDHQLRIGDVTFSLALPWHDYVGCDED